MKAKVKYTFSIHEIIIDLTYYGYDEHITWNNLSEEQQHMIEDSLRDEITIYVDVKQIKD